MIDVNKITKSFDEKAILNGISFQVKAGEKVILTGPSGCGKTTLLRILIGLEDVDTGEVQLKDSSGSPVGMNEVAWIPQDLGLWANLSAYENIGIVYKGGKATKKGRVMELLDALEISSLEKKKVSQLSSGEKQRVAIARALVNDVKLLVLDEPFSSLDLELRQDLFESLRRLISSDTTMLVVTHDPFDMKGIDANRVMVIQDGKLSEVLEPTSLKDYKGKNKTMQLWRDALIV